MPEQFANADTAKAGYSIGCVGRFYKQLSDSTVLVLHLGDSVQVAGTTSLQFDSRESLVSAKLWLFAKDSAHMSNICTDVVILDYPKPVSEALASSGLITLMEHPRVNYYGHFQPVTSILVQHITFEDPRSKKPIIVKDELLWKVPDLGVAA